MDTIKIRYNFRKLIGLTEYEEDGIRVEDVLIDVYGQSKVIRYYYEHYDSPEFQEDVTCDYGGI